MANVSISRSKVSSQPIQFIRPIRITLKCKLMKPHTRLYPFFDKVNIQQYCTQEGKAKGQPLMADSWGNLTVYFDVPGYTFSTGEKEFIITETADLTEYSAAGNTFGKASSKFVSSGIYEKYQTTHTTINTVVIENVVRREIVIPPPPPVTRDPIAQSFFTHDIPTGFFLTSIDLYFQSAPPVTYVNGVAAADEPVIVEIRKMVNGYPGPDLVSKHARCIQPHYNIKKSSNSSEATNFKFTRPIFIEPNGDYCFVVSSRSEKYQMWTARMNETDKLSNTKIFTQPFIGSMFKSENNRTWTAIQDEDVKFRINRAKFNTSNQGNARTFATNCTVRLFSKSIQTIKNSGYVFIQYGNAHSMRLGDKVSILPPLQLDNGTNITTELNGIPPNKLAGTYTVYKLISDYVIAVNINEGIAEANWTRATKTGPIDVDTRFVVSTNFRYNKILPFVDKFTPPGTEIKTKLSGYQENYNVHSSEPEISLDTLTNIGANLLSASRENEIQFNSNNPTVNVHFALQSNNDFLSPMIDLKDSYVALQSYTINDLSQYEDITSSNSRGYVTGINLVSGGSGYSGTPNVVIYAGDAAGFGADADATMSGGAVSGFTNLQPGYGYTAPPKIIFTESTSTTNAVATTSISKFNSELSPIVGNALSRYYSKTQTLNTFSTGAEVFVEAYSNNSSSFEVYIKTSNSSDSTNHNDYEWKLLKCDTPRNRSTKAKQFLEYKFYGNDFEPFDKYTIKIVLRSSTEWDPPIINNYRVIILI